MDTVIFVSNPFGLGPSGRISVVMEKLAGKWNGKIIYAAGSQCQEILPNGLRNRVDIVTLDERDEKQLRDLFLKYSKALVVISLNRIAIKTAGALGMRSIFIDSLAWMWKEIPREYLSADTYYYYDIFGAREKLKGVNNAKPISPMIGNLPPATGRDDTIIVHVGGFSNPLVQGFSESYLNTLAETIKQLNIGTPVIITGGVSAIRYLADQIGIVPNIEFKTFSRDEFLMALASAKRLVTTSGLMATLEAFALETPVSFLLSTNLSQWKQLRLLAQAKAAPLRMEWESFIRSVCDLDALNEKEAILKFRILSDEMCENKETKKFVISEIIGLFKAPIDTAGQKKFIQAVGSNGSSIIVGDILKLLNAGGN